MSTDFEVELRNSLRGVETSVRSLSKTMGMSEAQTSGFIKAMSDKLKALSAGHNESNEAAKKGKEAYEQYGHALSKLGGPIGEISERLTGSRGLTGSFVVLGIGIGAAGVAIRGLTDLYGAYMKKADDAAKVEDDLRQAIEATSKAAQDSTASAAQTEANSLKQLYATGDPAAYKQAKTLGQTGLVSQQEANTAVTSIHKQVPQALIPAAMDALTKLLKEGTPVGSATSTIVKNRYRMGVKPSSQEDDFLFEEANKIGFQNRSPGIAARAEQMVGGSKLINAAIGSQAKLNGAGLSAVTTNGAASLDYEGEMKAARLRDPQGVGMIEALHKLTEAMHRQSETLDRQNAFMKGMDDVKHWIGLGSRSDIEDEADTAAGYVKAIRARGLGKLLNARPGG